VAEHLQSQEQLIVVAVVVEVMKVYKLEQQVVQVSWLREQMQAKELH
jgi:hypothetical protein